MNLNNTCSVVTLKERFLLVLNTCQTKDAQPEIESLLFFDRTSACSSSTPSEKISWKSIQPRQFVVVEVTGHGEFAFTEKLGSTKFSSLREAYQAIGKCDSVTEYVANFGCLLLDKLYLLVASTVEEAASLPYGAKIWRVTQTQWVPLQLPDVAPLKLTSSDRSRLKEFQAYNHSSGYYYSEDVNLEIPFPFTKRGSAGSPQLHCNWSQNLGAKMRRLGLAGGCCTLIRGFVGEKTISTTAGGSIHLLLLGRQNKRNPGPRFHGRGLNSVGAAGNEHFYEYVIWSDYGNRVCYTKHVFFRGTIPVQWSTELGIEASMVFNHNTVYSQTEGYFKELFSTAKKNMELESSNSVSADPRIVCVNLLRLDKQHQESVLASHFSRGITLVKNNLLKLFPQGGLELINFDWLQFCKQFGTESAIQELWRKLMPYMAAHFSNDDSLISVGIIEPDGNVTRFVNQSQFARVNCADSLDRTNLCCFFLCLQCTIAMLSTFRLSSTSFTTLAPIPGLNTVEESGYATPSSSSPVVSPPYVDSWNDVVRGQAISSSVVRALAELFTANGDTVSRLYTNSVAMHGNLLRTVSGDRFITSNAVIATQRFYENTFEDGKKNRNLDLLLGRNRTTYFSPGCLPLFTFPIPYSMWSHALILSRIPPGSTAAEVEMGVNSWLSKNSCEPSKIFVCLQTEDEPADKPENASSRIAVVYLSSQRTCLSILSSGECILVKGVSCPCNAYSYPVQDYKNAMEENQDVKAALKDGFRQLVRGLT